MSAALAAAARTDAHAVPDCSGATATIASGIGAAGTCSANGIGDATGRSFRVSRGGNQLAALGEAGENAPTTIEVVETSPPTRGEKELFRFGVAHAGRGRARVLQ